MTGPVPRFSTEALTLTVVGGDPVTIDHGFGRQVEGWAVIWSDEHILFRIQDPAADTSRELTLIPSASGTVRLVLL